MRNYYIFILGFLGLFVFIVVVLGISLAGNPSVQRDKSVDATRISDFSSLKYEIERYYQETGKLPKKLTDLKSRIPVKDPKTKTEYDYIVETEITYKLCAEFSLDTREETDDRYSNSSYYNEQKHKKGYDCIEYKLSDYIIKPTVSPTPTITPIPKLVGFWTFDDGSDLSYIYDSSGNGNNGKTYIAGFMTGKAGNGMYYSGTSESYTKVPASESIKNLSGDFTLSFWTYRYDAGSKSLISNINFNEGGFAVLVGNKGEVYCRTSDGKSYTDSYTDYDTGYVLNGNGWHHIAIVRKGTNCNIYVDGLDKTSTRGYHTSVISSANPLIIGGEPKLGDQMYKGIIDEVRLYSGALSQFQIQEDMKKITPAVINL